MKKCTLSILAALYLLVTCGFSVNAHYCMGKFRSVNIGYSLKDNCSNCGMDLKKTGCCHDHTQWFKVDDNHQATGMQVAFHAPLIAVVHPGLIQAPGPYLSNCVAAGNNHSPPLIAGSKDLNIMHCVFRI